MAQRDITDDRNIAEAEQVWDSGIAFGPKTNTYRLMRALLSEADRIDNTIENICDQQHIDTATGDNLEKLGDLVDIDRETGEGDDRYRARIKAKFRAATTGTTFNQFTEFVAAVLNTDIDNIDFLTNYDASPAAISISAQSSLYDSVDMTPSDIRNIIDDGVPAGHEVNVLESGSFYLKADGDTDTAENGLTSDSITTGGTLAADLV